MACGMPEWRWLASWRLLAARSMVALCCRQAEKKAYELTYTPGGSAEEERPETRKACLYSDKQESILVLRCSNDLMLWRVALIPCACAWGCRSGRGGDAGVTSTEWLRGWGRLGAGGGGRCRPGHARLYQRLAGLIAAQACLPTSGVLAVACERQAPSSYLDAGYPIPPFLRRGGWLLPADDFPFHIPYSASIL